MITLPNVLGTATKIVDVLIVGGELGKKIVEGVTYLTASKENNNLPDST